MVRSIRIGFLQEFFEINVVQIHRAEDAIIRVQCLEEDRSAFSRRTILTFAPLDLELSHGTHLYP